LPLRNEHRRKTVNPKQNEHMLIVFAIAAGVFIIFGLIVTGLS